MSAQVAPSIGNQIVLFENPGNRGNKAAVTRPWYENPRSRGGNARSAHWAKHFIGPGNVGNSFAAGTILPGKYAVVTAANEHEGPGGGTDDRGITWYEQPEDPQDPWESKPPDHPGTPCRITMFQWNGGQAKEAVLADTGTQNQVVLPWRGGLLMADANHGAYGASRAVHVRLILP